MIGRFIGAGVLERIKTGRLLALCSACTATLVTVSMLTSGHLAMWSIIDVGFFNSIMFQGAMAVRFGIHHAFFLPVICYLYILFERLNAEQRTVRKQAGKRIKEDGDANRR